MKVYILFGVDYEVNDTLGVYDSLEKARAAVPGAQWEDGDAEGVWWADNVTDQSPPDRTIEEWEVQ